MRARVDVPLGLGSSWARLGRVAAALALFACGARPPSATAEPKRPAASDAPLVPYALDGDEAFARALREHYTKHEARVPMRDGVRLFTVWYAPKDTSRPWPMLLQRTPYGAGPYGVDNWPSAQNPRLLHKVAPSAALVRDGYVLVHQDVRGRMMSEGTFVDVRPARAPRAAPTDVDETTDAYDTIAWLVNNVPNTVPKVGTWGISYPGFYAAQAAISGHPALVAASPQAPVTDWFVGDDFHHNGAFFLADAFDFYSSFGRPRPAPTPKGVWEKPHEGADAYDWFLALGPVAEAKARFPTPVPFWDELARHETRDAFWLARDPRPRYRAPAGKVAVLTVGGLYDAEDLFGAVETYRAFERQSPGAENALVLGPWRHGGWARSDGDRHGDHVFGQKTSVFYRDVVEAPFFARHLKGRGGPPAEATVFETGTNAWRRFDAWPPKDTKPLTLFFAAAQALATKPPDADRAGDTYPSDPAKPVPYRARPGASIDADYMSEDQRFASRRPDVLSWSTEPLDADVTACGPVEADVWLVSTGTDADVVVKLVDVFPDDVADGAAGGPGVPGVVMSGYQALVRGEVFRAKFRDGFDRPKPLVPGEPARVRFTLPDACHAFRAGHRIMVQVQSSWFPLVDRNPQTFVDVFQAKPGDFKAATHTVLRDRAHPSSVTLRVRAGSGALR